METNQKVNFLLYVEHNIFLIKSINYGVLQKYFSFCNGLKFKLVSVFYKNTTLLSKNKSYNIKVIFNGAFVGRSEHSFIFPTSTVDDRL